MYSTMKNILIYFAFISFVFSSCSIYNGFGKRKYYDFSKNDNDIKCKTYISNDSENSNKITTYEDNEVASLITTPTLCKTFEAGVNLGKVSALSSEKPVKVCTSVSQNTSKNISQNETFFADTKQGDNFISTSKKSKVYSTVGEHHKGRFWWIWLIVAVVGLVAALVISAYPGLVIMILGLVFMFLSLLKYKKSKG
jgi:magnesium-transporting ATPase (P-type)